MPTLPIALDESVESKEETRLAYRYIDLKKERMRNNIILRHKVLHAIRTFMDAHNFVDVKHRVSQKVHRKGAETILCLHVSIKENFMPYHNPHRSISNC